MQGKLFDIAVLWHPTPTKEQAERGDSPKSVIIVKPDVVIAGTKEQAGLLAGRAIPEEHIAHLHECEIIVRPFTD